MTSLPDPAIVAAIRQEMGAAQRILIVSHIRPDGDAVGSLLGLGLALQAAGKMVQMVLSDGVPANFRYLHGSAEVRTQAEGQFDYRIVVDCAEVKRIGPALNGFGPPDLNIDHHPTNEQFGRTNLVIPEAVATAEILAQLLPDLGLVISPQVADALLTGLVTDTVGFRTSSLHPAAMRTVADLMEAGGDLPRVYYPALVQRSFPAVLYWGAGLVKLQREERMAWTSLTLNERHAAGYPDRDDADLINVLSAIEGVVLALIFVEQGPEHVKISWRVCGPASPDLDVSRVAQQFGGGGHRAAAGAEMAGSLAEVQETVLAATKKLLT